MDKRIAIIDVEADNLMPYASQIWVVCAKMVGESNCVAFHTPEELGSWLEENGPEVVAGNNFLGFDKAVLKKVWNIDIDMEIVDTLLLSQLLNPDRPDGHSLEAWGERLGYAKGNHTDFSQYSEEMEESCKRDVLLTDRVLRTLLYEVDSYGVDDFFNQPFWKAATRNYWLMSQQAITGIGFDKPKAEALIARIDPLMQEIVDSVEPCLPERPLNKGETDKLRLPAKPFLKSGEWSSSMHKWMEKTGAEKVDERVISLQGRQYEIVGGTPTVTTGPMTLSNQADLKNWFLELNWEPTLWNFKRDERGKPARDERGAVILTSPKLQENGRLCPNLEQLQGDLVKEVVKWLSLRNRKSVIEGWLGNDRLNFDGRLSAGAAGFASTFRQRHTEVVNVPKAQDDVTLGKEMRELFIAEEDEEDDMVMVGWDGVALEARVEAHYCWTYPGGEEHAENILEGDAHTKNAFVFYKDKLDKLGIVMEDGVKDNPLFKPFRSRSKNGRYALAYGCAPRKLATTLGEPEGMGETLYAAFWEANPALTAFRERLTEFWETTGEKKWVRGIDGRKVRTRSKHSVVNTLFQSCGAIVMDYSALFMDKWLGGLGIDKAGRPCYTWKGKRVYRVGYFHDEYIYVCPRSIADELGELGVKSIVKAGEWLKLNVPLSGDYKVGLNWSQIH